MPVLDGFAFTRLLREREGRNGQPRLTVLALTASVLDDDARRCREAGMDEVLSSRCRWQPCAPRCCAGCRRRRDYRLRSRRPDPLPTMAGRCLIWPACSGGSAHAWWPSSCATACCRPARAIWRPCNAPCRPATAKPRRCTCIAGRRPGCGWGDGAGRAGQRTGRAPAGCGRDRSGTGVRSRNGVRGTAAAPAAAIGSLSRLLLQVGDHQRAPFGAGKGVVHAGAGHHVGGRLQEGIQSLRARVMSARRMPSE